VFRLSSNGGEPKLPPDKEPILFVVRTFAAQRRSIFAPRGHHCFPKPVSHVLSELHFNETPIPARGPALTPRTLNRLPQIPTGVRSAIRREAPAGISDDFAPKRHPACMCLCVTSFSVLCIFLILRLQSTQFGSTRLRFQPVVDHCHETWRIRDE